MEEIRLGTIGSGVIVHSVLGNVLKTPGIRLTAVYSRSQEKGDALAAEFGAKKVYTDMDAFLAVTGRSETNILAALLARRMGVKKVIAEVENLNYINLAESMGIDTIVNKKLITASNIFRFTMSSDVQAIKYLTGSEAEVMEFIAKPNSPATRSRIKEMGLPENVIIGGIVRGDKVEIAVGSTEIKAFDRVVVFALPDAVERVCDFFN